MHVVWHRGISVSEEPAASIFMVVGQQRFSNLMMKAAGSSRLYGNTSKMTIILIFIEVRTLNLRQ
jgi:hypothetical protein